MLTLSPSSRNSTSRRPRVVAAALAAAAALAVLAPSQALGAQTMGVQAHVLWSNVNHAQMIQQLDAAKAAGAGLVRVDVGWGTLEPVQKGVYDTAYLARLDDVVTEANARGLKLLVIWWLTPCWASSAPESLKQDCQGAWWDRGVTYYPPTTTQDFADPLAFLVARYQSRVAGWEIWNEPNTSYYFTATDPAASYTALVKAAYVSAKGAYPRARIVAGALSESDVDFTAALYADGIKGYFDAFSIHPYSGDRSPLDTAPGSPARYSFIRGVPAVHDQMVANGDSRPLWLTELGWSTCTFRGGPSWANCVDQPTQASYLNQAFVQMRSWSYVRVGVWYGLQDRSADPAGLISNYGLLGYDGSQKLAYGAFRSLSGG